LLWRCSYDGFNSACTAVILPALLNPEITALAILFGNSLQKNVIADA